MAKEETAADMVFGVSKEIIADLYECSSSAVSDLGNYSLVYKNMGVALTNIKLNLEKHVAKKKWLRKAERNRLNMQMKQLDAMIKACSRLSASMEKSLRGCVIEMDNIEKTPLLAKFLDDIESDIDDDRGFDPDQ
jgi:hypothetical protein